MQSRVLVVGAGLAGLTIARSLAEKDYKVDVIDKRNHIGGNAYDYMHPTGIRVHQYGPHIFHTSNMRVVKFLSKYTDWVPYRHRAKALLADGSYVSFPPNQETQNTLGKENISSILFEPYSKKMWGMNLNELDPSIIQRVHIKNSKNEDFFPKDTFQEMPKKGYTNMFENIVDHQNIKLNLNTSYTKDLECDYDKIFNSMPIDEYYDYKFGELPYRSMKFINKIVKGDSTFPTAQVNFTDDGPYTRVVDWKLFPNHGTNPKKTLLTYERPCDFKDNAMERYYPIKDYEGNNRKLYNKYSKIKNVKTEFIGRCGLYVYIDMHQAVSSSLAITRNFLRNK